MHETFRFVYHKLLSHRLRGFSKTENTKSALLNSLSSNVPYLEIDTRVSKDGNIFVHHNPVIRSKEGKIQFSKENAVRLNILHYRNGESLLSFDDLLTTFQAEAPSDKTLCIDIKDFGFEKQHLDGVRKFDLESRVIFISWIPQTLIRLSELGAKTPLILSHINLMKFGFFGNILAFVFQDSLLRLYHFVLMGAGRMERSIKTLTHGFLHFCFCRTLPDNILSILAASGSGICVSKRLVCEQLLKYAYRHNLKLMVFSVIDLEEYQKYASIEGIDVVFCDDVPGVLNKGTVRKTV